MLTKNQLCFIIIFICTIFIFHWFASMLDMSVPELMRQFNERKQERNTSKRRPRSSLIYTSKSLSRKCDKSDEKPSTKNYNAFIAGGVRARHTELCCAKPHSQGLSSLVPLHLSCSRGTGVERPWEQCCALKCCQSLVQSPSNSVVLPAAISFFFFFSRKCFINNVSKNGGPFKTLLGKRQVIVLSHWPFFFTFLNCLTPSLSKMVTLQWVACCRV